MQKANLIVNNLNALGTTWFIELYNLPKNTHIKQLRIELTECIFQFEANYSRFNTKSMLMKLNRKRKVKNCSKEFIELINLGIKYYKDTDQIFNFGIGKTLSNNGYGKPTKIQTLPLNDTSITININTVEINGDFELDFGGFGKGYLIDKIASILKMHNIYEFLINGGGDILATSCKDEPLIVYIQDPQNLKKYKHRVALKNTALCNSSTYKRTWIKDGKTHSHIFDAKNNISIINRHISIASTNCVEADMLATTLCIDNSSDFIKRLKSKYNFEVLLS
jgi:thiamine biosynthesis lipoprotein